MAAWRFVAVSFHSPQALDFSNSKELGEAPVETAAPVATKGGGMTTFRGYRDGDISFSYIYRYRIYMYI